MVFCFTHSRLAYIELMSAAYNYKSRHKVEINFKTLNSDQGRQNWVRHDSWKTNHSEGDVYSYDFFRGNPYYFS